RSGELRDTQSKLEAAQASAVDAVAVQAARAQSASLASDRTKLQQDKDALDARWSQLVAFPASSPAKRAAALRQLTRMLWDRGLYPFDESPAKDNGQLPASLDDVMKRLTVGGTAA